MPPTSEDGPHVYVGEFQHALRRAHLDGRDHRSVHGFSVDAIRGYDHQATIHICGDPIVRWSESQAIANALDAHRAKGGKIVTHR